MTQQFKCTFASKNPPATEDDVRAYEVRAGSSLPTEYRDFLLHCNGGVPSPQQVDIPKTPHSVLIGYLYGILPNRSRGDLEYETDRMSENLPDGFIAIGHDPGGNSFLLATQGEGRGRVYFWDKRGLLSIKEGSGNTFWLADNISDLIQSVYAAKG